MNSRPFSITFRDTKQSIINIINDSGLPAEIIQAILELLLVEVRSQADQVYENDVMAYSLNSELIEEGRVPAQPEQQLEQEEANND